MDSTLSPLPPPSPSSPGSTSGESLSATEESGNEGGVDGEGEVQTTLITHSHHFQGAIPHGALAGPSHLNATTTTSASASGSGSGSGAALSNRQVGGASSTGAIGSLSTRRRHHHHHHNLALGTGAAKMGSSITDSAQSTEDEMYEGEEEEDEVEEEDNDLEDEQGRPVVHYPALATPTVSKGSSWPFGTVVEGGGGSGVELENDPIQQQQYGNQEQATVAAARKASVSSVVTMIDATPDTIHFNPRHSQQQRDLHLQQLQLHYKNRSNAAHLPHEILLKILRNVRSTPDLVSSLAVCKSWCQCGVELLWNKPLFPSVQPLIKMLVVLTRQSSTFPYSSFIKRLNFSQLADRMSDALLMKLDVCDRLERLTLAGCSDIGDEAMIRLLGSCRGMIALDLSECVKITDATCAAIARNCSKLQGLNLSGCKLVTDRGLQEVAKGCPKLRRVKLRNLESLTDPAIIALALHCPLLLEVDLYSCSSITDRTLWALFRNSSHLRELSLNGCSQVTGDGFPQKDGSLLFIAGSTDPLLQEKPLNHKFNSSTLAQAAKKALNYYGGDATNSPLANATPLSSRMFEHVRYLDLTGLGTLTDQAMEGIVATMPHIRNLVLAKCSNLTDDSVLSISKLGRHIHFLHLGHVSSITDKAVRVLAKSCTRLRYIDLACCPLLTDLSVLELAQNLPRLKRIGLVRVSNLTDQAINELAHRTTLERIHLSYCENVSVPAVHFLLSKLTRLNHLSLTGVPAFRRADLQHFCRPPPKDFNAHQRSTFCVYSGKGVVELRRHLLNLQQREYMEGVLGNVSNGPLGTGSLGLGANGPAYQHPYHNANMDIHAPLPPGFQLPGTLQAQLGTMPQDITADLVDEDIDEEAEADGEDETGDDEGEGEDEPQSSRHQAGSSRSHNTRGEEHRANGAHRHSHRHHHQQFRTQDAHRSHETGSGRASSSRHAAQLGPQTEVTAAISLSPVPSPLPPSLAPTYSTSLQGPLPNGSDSSLRGNQNVANWFRWQSPSPSQTTPGTSYQPPSLAATEANASNFYNVQPGRQNAAARYSAPSNLQVAGHTFSFSSPRAPAASSGSESSSYLDTLPSPPQIGAYPSLQPAQVATTGSSSGSHYLNTEALHNLVDPSILRAAQEQELFEQQAAAASGQTVSNASNGRDADGDQRMRSMSVEFEQHNLQSGEGDMDLEEERRNGRGRRNTIRQSNYQMEQS